MTPNKITVHCSATPNGAHYDAQDIEKWHIARGFKTIGYHGVICVNGDFQRGRPDDIEGAHVKGHNEGNLGIVLIGNDKFSMPQWETLKWYVKNKCAAYKITEDNIFCHYEWDTAQAEGKTCPNVSIARVKAWLFSDVLEALEPHVFKS